MIERQTNSIEKQKDMTLQEIKNRLPELEEKIGRAINLWVKGGHARLYVNKNQYKCYGYVDLINWKAVGYGNQVSVTELFELLNTK